MGLSQSHDAHVVGTRLQEKSLKNSLLLLGIALGEGNRKCGRQGLAFRGAKPPDPHRKVKTFPHLLW